MNTGVVLDPQGTHGGLSVDLGVAATFSQHHSWWSTMMERVLFWTIQANLKIRILVSTSATPAKSKGLVLDRAFDGAKQALTHENRNQVVEWHREGDPLSDYIFFVDQDTIPPKNALPRLIAHQRKIVAGVYYHRNVPHAPLMYHREPINGRYAQIEHFEKGALMEVDATGMGCTLIHRSVFEDIHAQFVRYLRLDEGSEFLVHRDDIKERRIPKNQEEAGPAYWPGRDNGVMCIPARPVTDIEAEAWSYPWFNMSYNRTEDVGFCELAKRAGHEIWVDTSIECEHSHLFAVTGDHFRALRDQAIVQGKTFGQAREEVYGENS